MILICVAILVGLLSQFYYISFVRGGAFVSFYENSFKPVLSTFLNGFFSKSASHQKFQILYWIHGGSRRGPMKQGLSVLPSFHLSGHFLGIASVVFSKFWHGGRNPYEIVRDRAISTEKKKKKKKKFLQKFGNGPVKWSKTGFF